MQRQAGGVELALGGQRLQGQRALVVELARRGLAALARCGGAGGERESFGLAAVAGQVAGGDAQGRHVQRHGARLGVVGQRDGAALHREIGHAQLPGCAGAGGGCVSRCRRGRGAAWRCLQPALEHPAPVRAPFHRQLRLADGQALQRGGACVQGHFGPGNVELAQAGQGGLALLDGQLLQRQGACLEGDAGGACLRGLWRGRLPQHTHIAAELAGHRGLQRLGQVGRGQLQGQGVQGGVDLGLLVRGFAGEAECAALQVEPALEGKGFGEGDGDVGRIQRDLCGLQGRCGARGLVGPAQGAAAHCGGGDFHDPGGCGLGLGFAGGSGRGRGRCCAGAGQWRRRRFSRCRCRRCGGLALDRRWRRCRRCQLRQVDLACCIARGGDHGRGQLHMLQSHHLVQRAHIGHVDFQALIAQQVGALAVCDAYAAGLHGAGQLHGHARVLLKGHLHIRIQRGAQHLDGQVGWQIAQVGREVQPVQPNLRVSLAGLRKRRALGGRVKPAAIERERQVGLDLHLALRRQGADERHLEGQVAHLVGFIHGGVREVDAATRQCQVVQRHPCGAFVGLGFAGGRGDLGDDVVHVIAAVAQVGDAQHRVFDGEGVHHGRQAQQRLQLAIGIDAANGQLWGRAVGTRHGHVAQREFQAPGLKVDAPHGDGAAQLFGRNALQRPLDQRRNGQPGDQPQDDQTRQRADDRAEPAVLAQGGRRDGAQGDRHGGRQK